MDNPMGDSPAGHEGTDEIPRLKPCGCAWFGPRCEHHAADYPKDAPQLPLTISEDQLSIYVANTAHLVLYKLRKEMHREIDKQVSRLRIDHEKRWEQTLAQLKDLVRMETIV